ncbi:MAG: alpha/beta hydrolase [Polyangiaceae bacterium]
MSIVLLHGSANGAYSWGSVRQALASQLPSDERVFAVDMLGYGASPAPSANYDMAEEVAHLHRAIERQNLGPIHLVAHSLGVMFALHLRLALSEAKGSGVVRMTLFDPVLVSVLREKESMRAYEEMEAVYTSAMVEEKDPAVIAKRFVEHWGGPDAWSGIGDKARQLIQTLVPKVQAEIAVARADTTPLASLTRNAPPSRVIVGEHTRLPVVEGARELARALGVDVSIIPGAGHMLPLTHPGAVARWVASGSAD